MAAEQILEVRLGGVNPGLLGTDSEEEVPPATSIQQQRKRLKSLETLNKMKKRQKLEDARKRQAERRSTSKVEIATIPKEEPAKVLDLGCLVKMYKKIPSFKGDERGMDPKKMLMALIKEFTFGRGNSPISFSQWEEMLEKPNHQVYKQYFEDDKENDDEYMYYSKIKGFHTKMSQTIWRYAESKENKVVTCAILVKLFESSQNGSTDRSVQRQQLGQNICSRALTAFRSKNADIWKLRLTLPNDIKLKQVYKKALFEDQVGEAQDTDINVDSRCDSNNYNDDDSYDEENLPPNCSISINRRITEKVVIINDTKRAIKAIKVSLAREQEKLEEAQAESAELQERIKVSTGCEDLVSAITFGVSPTLEILGLLQDYNGIIKMILNNPESVNEGIEQMNDVLSRFSVMMEDSSDMVESQLEEIQPANISPILATQVGDNENAAGAQLDSSGFSVVKSNNLSQKFDISPRGSCTLNASKGGQLLQHFFNPLAIGNASSFNRQNTSQINPRMTQQIAPLPLSPWQCADINLCSAVCTLNSAMESRNDSGDGEERS